jgi:hypothetical protein
MNACCFLCEVGTEFYVGLIVSGSAERSLMESTLGTKALGLHPTKYRSYFTMQHFGDNRYILYVNIVCFNNIYLVLI